jgi:YVTN family beta-propeller protein
VSVIRVSDNTVVGTIAGLSGPQFLAVSGGFAYVANSSSNSVSVIRLSDRTIVDTITVGNYPYAVAASQTYVYVTNFSSNSLSVIDIDTRTVIATVLMGQNPAGVATLGDSVFVSNYGGTTESVIRVPADSGITSTAELPPPWLQAYQRPARDSACLDGWSPSWAQWPGSGTGGFTCERTEFWSSVTSSWAFNAGFRW